VTCFYLSEPLDEQLPPDAHFTAVAPNDQTYPLLFDFPDPPPLPRSKTKAQDSLPKGPRMLDTTRSATTNESNSPARTSRKTLGAPNGLSYRLILIGFLAKIKHKALLHTLFLPNRCRYHGVDLITDHEGSNEGFRRCRFGLQNVLSFGRW